MIICSEEGPIWHIELDGDTDLNYLDAGDLQQLGDTWEAFATAAEARIAIVSGAGDRAFSAGAKIDDIGTSMTDESASPAAMRYSLRDVRVGKPIIAAVNGYALGAGFEIMLGADIRMCSTTASFGVPEVRWGAVPAGGALARLARHIPRTWAARLLLTGERISADVAVRIGLVTDVLSPEELYPAAEAIAHLILENSPDAVTAIKSHFESVDALELRDAYESERVSARSLAASPDAKEGAAAFRERRKPRYGQHGV